jgi:hypothetical protein
MDGICTLLGSLLIKGHEHCRSLQFGKQCRFALTVWEASQSVREEFAVERLKGRVRVELDVMQVHG